MWRFLPILIIPTFAHADDVGIRPMRPDSDHDTGPCHDMPHSCHRADKVRNVELYAATDKNMAMFALVLPDKPDPVVTDVFSDGGTPNDHHFEMCGSKTEWSQLDAALDRR